MTKWLCPNKAKVPGHAEKILFSDQTSGSADIKVAYMQVPKPEYCDICNRYYTKAECPQVVS